MLAASSAHVRRRAPKIRGLLALAGAALITPAAGADEPAAPDLAALGITAAELGLSDAYVPAGEAEDHPVFLYTFDDDYYWLSTAELERGQTGRSDDASLFDPSAFQVRAKGLGLQFKKQKKSYRFNNIGLFRYDRKFTYNRRKMRLKVRTPGKRKSIMSVELKF